jgi:hypothetical protein
MKLLFQRFLLSDADDQARASETRNNFIKKHPLPEHPTYLTYSEVEMVMSTMKWIVKENPHPENVKMQIKSDYDKIMKAWNPNYES